MVSEQEMLASGIPLLASIARGFCLSGQEEDYHNRDSHDDEDLLVSKQNCCHSFFAPAAILEPSLLSDFSEISLKACSLNWP